MGGLDPAKIFLVLVIALIVVGPERLPGLARQLGGAWRELNKLREKFDQEVRSMIPDLDLPKIPTSPGQAVSGYLTGLVSGLGDTSTGSAATAVTGSASETMSSVASRGTSWVGADEHDGMPSNWQPLLGRQDPTSTRRPPSVPLSMSSGSLSADTRSADTVFVFDEPSMN